MRVISLVPSWTETLIEAGIEVVGRSRYCIHPQPQVSRIPKVGGTKDFNLSDLKDLNADFLLLDREENTLKMAQSSPFEVIDTHVESLTDLKREFNRLSQIFENERLLHWSTEVGRVLKQPPANWSWKKIPGFIEWIRSPDEVIGFEPQQFVYLIWRKPWMSVGKNTFIGSMISQLGGGKYQWCRGDEKYPQLKIEDLDRKTTLLLCSSEPYPFARKREVVRQTGMVSALIDGEGWSWFGIRGLRFLQTHL